MFTRAANRVSLWLAVFCAAAFFSLATEGASPAKPANNLFTNPSFEDGKQPWSPAAGGITEVTYSVDNAEAADGKKSALIKLGNVESFGLQFGQKVGAPVVGKTYTFAVLARSLNEPLEMGLEIERPADPWDRAAKLQGQKVANEWKELHVTFKVEKAFAEGWYAYVHCAAECGVPPRQLPPV